MGQRTTPMGSCTDASAGTGTGDLPPRCYYRCAGTMLTGNFITSLLGAHWRERGRACRSLRCRQRDVAVHRRSRPQHEVWVGEGAHFRNVESANLHVRGYTVAHRHFDELEEQVERDEHEREAGHHAHAL